MLQNYMTPFTPTQKYEAIQNICPLACIKQNREGKWVIHLDGISVYTGDKDKYCQGDTIDRAIENCWSFLTGEKAQENSWVSGPLDQKVIIKKENMKIWYQWDKFMWKIYLIQ